MLKSPASEKRPPLTNCCFCFRVETGTQIIAAISAICSLFVIISSSVYMSNIDIKEKWLKEEFKKAFEKDGNTEYYDQYEWVIDEVNFSIRKFHITAIIQSITLLIIIAVLFIGMKKRKAMYLLPYMVVEGISLIIVGILIILIGIIGFAIAIIYHTYAAAGITILIVTIYSAIYSLFIYMWIVVYSHYVVLKEENTRGGYGKARGEA